MKDKLKKSLALKVKALREAASITQEELAYKCDVSWRTISNLERALVVPDLVMLYKISQIFNVSIDLLLEVNIHQYLSVNVLPSPLPCSQSTVLSMSLSASWLARSGETASIARSVEY